MAAAGDEIGVQAYTDIYDNQVQTVTGILLQLDGKTGISGQVLSLQRSNDNSTWVAIGNATTNSAGNASISFYPLNQGGYTYHYYRAVFAGNSSYLANTSNSANATIYQTFPTAITIQANHNPIYDNAPLTLSGAVTRSDTGAGVGSGFNVDVFASPDGTSWQMMNTETFIFTGSNSWYTFTFYPADIFGYQYRYFMAKAEYIPEPYRYSNSSTIYVTIYESGPSVVVSGETTNFVDSNVITPALGIGITAFPSETEVGEVPAVSGAITGNVIISTYIPPQVGEAVLFDPTTFQVIFINPDICAFANAVVPTPTIFTFTTATAVGEGTETDGKASWPMTVTDTTAIVEGIENDSAEGSSPFYAPLTVMVDCVVNKPLIEISCTVPGTTPVCEAVENDPLVPIIVIPDPSVVEGTEIESTLSYGCCPTPDTPASDVVEVDPVVIIPFQPGQIEVAGVFKPTTNLVAVKPTMGIPLKAVYKPTRVEEIKLS